MTKKVVIAFCFWMIALAGAAQEHMPARTYTYSDEGPGNGFLKQNLYLGGGLNLGAGTDEFAIGVTPEIGYSLNRWLDAGLVVNFTYGSISSDPYYGILGSKQFTYGGGAYARAYVLPFLFLTAQPEYNWTTVKQDEGGGETFKQTVSAPSLLLGLGYAHRIVGMNNFYIALMFDALSNTNSPYNDVNGHPLPVIKAGVNFYLHGSR